MVTSNRPQGWDTVLASGVVAACVFVRVCMCSSACTSARVYFSVATFTHEASWPRATLGGIRRQFIAVQQQQNLLAVTFEVAHMLRLASDDSAAEQHEYELVLRPVALP